MPAGYVKRDCIAWVWFVLISTGNGMLSTAVCKQKKGGVILMREESNDLMVLEEGVEAGVVQACCTTGATKV